MEAQRENQAGSGRLIIQQIKLITCPTNIEPHSRCSRKSGFYINSASSMKNPIGFKVAGTQRDHCSMSQFFSKDNAMNQGDQ